MKRVTWVMAILVLVAGTAGLARELWRIEEPPGPRPNIVVLLWDTTRADHLSTFGYARETTPWLESLAARGVRFEQCRAPAPWTAPSHASLFTGLLARHHGIAQIENPLAPAHHTLAERLGEAGYDTMLVFNNTVLDPASGLTQGFDRVLSVIAERGEGAGSTFKLIEKELAGRREDPVRSARPLFLFVNLFEPHLNYDPPPDLAQPWLPAEATPEEVEHARKFNFPGDLAHNLGIDKLDGATLDILRALYDAEVLDLDTHCGRIEDLLEREGILGEGVDTLFVVTADHGENLGEHGLIDHKLSLSEPLLHVPLVMHWPGHFEGGRSVAEQVRLQDLFPTLLEAAGLDWDPDATPFATSLLETPLRARTQVAEFTAARSFLPDSRELFPYEPEENFEPLRLGFVAILAPDADGRHLKWVRTTRLEDDGSKTFLGESLFDLGADPGERRDLLKVPNPAPADLEAARSLAEYADAALAPR